MERGSAPVDGMASHRGMVAETGGIEPPLTGVKGPRLNRLAMSPYFRPKQGADLKMVVN